MKRTDVEREIQRVMMDHKFNDHPKPLSVTTCYPDVPAEGTETHKPTTMVTWWDGMGREDKYSFVDKPDIERVKRELRFGEIDGAWVIRVKSSIKFAFSGVNDSDLLLWSKRLPYSDGGWPCDDECRGWWLSCYATGDYVKPEEVVASIAAYWTRKVGNLTVRAYEDDGTLYMKWSNCLVVINHKEDHLAYGEVHRAICTVLDIPICPASVHKGDMRAP